MKHILIFLPLMASLGCRSTRVVQSTTTLHDTITIEAKHNENSSMSDSTASCSQTETMILHTTIDSAGRVRSITRMTKHKIAQKKAKLKQEKTVEKSISASRRAMKNEQKKTDRAGNSMGRKFFFAVFFVFFGLLAGKKLFGPRG